ncbi:hypothetical protein THERMOT_1123 [Bathymodiolus thermophilus thioautotrophic gill symbiont]|nr:hypothetical protein THERMOT_1123 [Bathymodiolus thermophilus thioautotrophic gill symbiont]
MKNLRNLFKSVALATTLLSTVVFGNPDNDITAISSKLSSDGKTFAVTIDFDDPIMWASARPGSAYDGGEWCFDDLMKVNGEYGATCTSISLSSGMRMKMEVRNLPRESTVTMSRSAFVSALENNFTKRTDEWFDVDWDNDTDEKFCQLNFPANGAMQSWYDEDCNSLEIERINWILTYNFKTTYSDKTNTATFSNSFHSPTKAMPREGINPMTNEGITLTVSAPSTRTYYRLFKVNGRYFPASGKLSADGADIKFTLTNLPQEPNVEISWNDYFNLLKHRFRAPSGRFLDATRAVQRYSYFYTVRGSARSLNHTISHNGSRWNRPLNSKYTKVWENNAVGNWNTASKSINTLVLAAKVERESNAKDVNNSALVEDRKVAASTIKVNALNYIQGDESDKFAHTKEALSNLVALFNLADETTNKIIDDTLRANAQNTVLEIKGILDFMKTKLREVYAITGLKGFLKYPTLKGVTFTASESNYINHTNDKGEYFCQPGEDVTFSIGLIKLFSVSCNSTNAGDSSTSTITLIKTPPTP